MFTRNVKKTIFYSKPNLTPLSPESDYINIRNNYLFRYDFVIQEINISNLINQAKTFNQKFKKIVNDTLIKKLLKRNASKAISKSIKDHSSRIIKEWGRQCECVIAQRLRRGQQMFCLYSRLWEENALKELMRKMGNHLLKNGKHMMLGAVGVSVYNFNEKRIPEDLLLKQVNALDYVRLLKNNTVICDECQNKLPKNKYNLTICECETKVTKKQVFENWEPFIEKEDLIVWRKLHENGCYEYKVYGSYDDVSAEDFLNVQIDTDYRKTWDTTAVALEVIERDPDPSTNSDVVYWEMQWPVSYSISNLHEELCCTCPATK